MNPSGMRKIATLFLSYLPLCEIKTPSCADSANQLPPGIWAVHSCHSTAKIDIVQAPRPSHGSVASRLERKLFAIARTCGYRNMLCASLSESRRSWSVSIG